MNSIILELQREAMDHRTPLRDLLRKSLVVATKLELGEWSQWCKSELNGYSSGQPIPSYRVLHGELKMFNPYNGVWMEFAGAARVIKSVCSQPVAEVEDLTTETNGMICQLAPPEVVSLIEHVITPPRLILSRTELVGILEAVRNAILEWTLKLEADGILGNGMTFTSEEKGTAATKAAGYSLPN